MSEIPNIKLPKMRSSGDDWCRHYAGFFNHGLGTGKKIHCDAGVEYESVAVKVDFTTQRHHERTPYLQHVAHPCFKHQAHLTGGCDKCSYHTEAELEAKHKEITAFVDGVGIARKAIIGELESRRNAGDPDVKHNGQSDPEVEDGPTNFISGHGVIKCPICTTGNLSYSRSSYNGHIHARCSTEGCVAWME